MVCRSLRACVAFSPPWADSGTPGPPQESQQKGRRVPYVALAGCRGWRSGLGKEGPRSHRGQERLICSALGRQTAGITARGCCKTNIQQTPPRVSGVCRSNRLFSGGFPWADRPVLPRGFLRARSRLEQPNLKYPFFRASLKRACGGLGQVAFELVAASLGPPSKSCGGGLLSWESPAIVVV